MYGSLGFKSMVVVFAATLVVALQASPVRADAGKCKAAIIKGGAAYIQARSKALAKCEEAIVKGKASDSNCRLTASAALDKAATKLNDTISKACGGKGKSCDVGGDGDDPPATIGWTFSTCPDYENAGCDTTTITTCSDIIDCVQCIGAAATDRAIDVAYGQFKPTTPKSNKIINKCQVAIGKATSTFFIAKSKALAKCWTSVNAGKAVGDCPLADGKATSAITKAETKKISTICKACGGDDKECNGLGDALVTDIGFAAECPPLTIPDGGKACGKPVTSLNLLSECVDCVNEFAVDCADRSTVPAEFLPYPAECNPAVVASPTATITLTPTATATPLSSATRSVTPTPDPSPTTTPDGTATTTPDGTATTTPDPTATTTPDPTATTTPDGTATTTPDPTATTTPDGTATTTPDPTATTTPDGTATTTPDPTATTTPDPTATTTPDPTATTTPDPTATTTPDPTATTTPDPTATTTPDPTATTTPDPTATTTPDPTATTTPDPTATTTPDPTATTTPDPTATSTPEPDAIVSTPVIADFFGIDVSSIPQNPPATLPRQRVSNGSSLVIAELGICLGLKDGDEGVGDLMDGNLNDAVIHFEIWTDTTIGCPVGAPGCPGVKLGDDSDNFLVDSLAANLLLDPPPGGNCGDLGHGVEVSIKWTGGAVKPNPTGNFWIVGVNNSSGGIVSGQVRWGASANGVDSHAGTDFDSWKSVDNDADQYFVVRE